MVIAGWGYDMLTKEKLLAKARKPAEDALRLYSFYPGKVQIALHSRVATGEGSPLIRSGRLKLTLRAACSLPVRPPTTQSGQPRYRQRT